MTDPEEREYAEAVDAGEYVLGTLPEADRRRFEQQLERDPELRDLVDAWEHHFMALFYRLPVLAPPATLWSAIEHRINRLSVNYGEERKPMWSSIAFWRVSALAAAVAVIALAVFTLLRPAGGSFDPVKGLQEYVWVLTDANKRPSFVVKFDKDRKRITIVPLGQVAEGDKSLQLWLVPAAASSGQSSPPKSLGLVKPSSITTLDLDSRSLGVPINAGILAVSSEPPGGSTTGAPTGPVILQGKPDPVPN